MRKILVVLLSLVLGAQFALANTCATKLMPVFTSAQATKLCVSFGSAINGNLIPSATDTYDLGTTSLRWQDLFLSGVLNMNLAASKIVPGATSLSLRNNANSADNLILTDAGVATLRSNLTFAAAAAKIIPGATSLTFRNTADSANNLSIIDAGDATFRTGITLTNGDLVIANSGRTVSIQEATAGSACSGTLTLTAATPVVTSTTCATTGSRIFLTRTSIDADTTGDMAVTAISNGVSFSVTSEANDTATVNWVIFHEAP